MSGNTLTKMYMDQLTDGQLTWVPLDDNFDSVAIGKPGEHRKYPLMCGSRKIFRDALVKYFPDEEKAIDKYMALIKASGKFLGIKIPTNFVLAVNIELNIYMYFIDINTVVVTSQEVRNFRCLQSFELS